MEFAKGPTDNIYKFVALSGIALAGLFIVLASNTHSTWIKTKIEAETARTAINNKIKFQSIWQERQLKKIEYQIDSANDKTPKQEVSNLGDKFNELLEKIGDRWDGLHDETKEANIKIGTHQAVKDTYFAAMITYVVFVITSFGISAIGFRHWYTKLQVHLDKRVKAESEKAEIKNIHQN